MKKGDRDGKDFSTSQNKLDDIRREVRDTVNSEAKSAEAKSANGDSVVVLKTKTWDD